MGHICTNFDFTTSVADPEGFIPDPDPALNFQIS